MSHELAVASVVRNVSRWGIGRDLGEPRLYDDGSMPAMFDIEFRDTVPRAAMEVTRVVDGSFAQTANAAQEAVERTLRSAVEASSRPQRWVFEMVAGTNVNSLKAAMLGWVASGVAPQEEDLPFGMMSVSTDPDAEPDAVIVTWSGTGALPLLGLSGDLADAIASNREKLAAAEGFEHHLAVDVHALRASDPASTPAPVLPAEIDFLWVIRGTYSVLRGSPVVWVTDGLGTWKVNGEPHESM